MWSSRPPNEWASTVAVLYVHVVRVLKVNLRTNLQRWLILTLAGWCTVGRRWAGRPGPRLSISFTERGPMSMDKVGRVVYRKWFDRPEQCIVGVEHANNLAD